jgi:hypothetical protein
MGNMAFKIPFIASLLRGREKTFGFCLESYPDLKS